MTAERKELLKLLSRFSLSSDQVKRFFVPDDRPDEIDDASLIENPYLLYELDRASVDAISVATIDRGMLPGGVVLKEHPLPERSRLTDKVDSRRARALVIAALEQGAEQGHTLLPRALLSTLIANMPLETDCPVGPEVLTGLGDLLEGVVEPVEMADDRLAYQLQRFVDTADLVRRTVRKRTAPKSQRHRGDHDFAAVVNASLGDLPLDSDDAKIEIQARREKAAALEETFASRLSVLIGAAGTGKTTLLKMLCELDDVAAGGVLPPGTHRQGPRPTRNQDRDDGRAHDRTVPDALWRPIRHSDRPIRRDAQSGSLPRLQNRHRRRMLHAHRRAARRLA